jgi:hypothetical protein
MRKLITCAVLVAILTACAGEAQTEDGPPPLDPERMAHWQEVTSPMA